ncbi:MAG: substrate-binding periplasmic protein [Syntrophobacteraceae bacterium]
MVCDKKVLLSVVMISCLVSSSAGAEAPLRIAYPSFPPFHWVKESGEMAGCFYEIITEALVKRMGMNVVWTVYPWPRCQENLKTGKDDAILTVPTAERLEYTVTHRYPFYRKPLNVFTYAGHERMSKIRKIKRIIDLKEEGFAVITYSGNGWNRENVEARGVKTYEASYLENVWKMLVEKRGDIVLEWPPGAWPAIKRSGAYDQVIDTSITIAEMPFHLLIRRESPYVDRLVLFDKTIMEMDRDGTLLAIMAKNF